MALFVGLRARYGNPGGRCGRVDKKTRPAALNREGNPGINAVSGAAPAWGRTSVSRASDQTRARGAGAAGPGGGYAGPGLGAFHGPALAMAADGTVIEANPKASTLARLLDQGVPPLAALLEESAATGRVLGGPLSLDGPKGEMVLDLSVVPLGGDKPLLVLVRDLTMERNLRTALVESRQRYKDLVDVSSDFAWEVGPEGEFVFVSPRGALGYDADELVGRRPADFVMESDKCDPLPFYGREPQDETELWMRDADGALTCVLLTSLPLLDDGDLWCGARGVCRDVTREREREAALNRIRYREQMLNYIVGVIRGEVDPENMLATAAAAAGRALGATGCRIYRRGTDGSHEVAARFGEADEPEGLAGLLGRLEGTPDPVRMETGDVRVLGAATRHNQPVNGAIVAWRSIDKGAWQDDDAALFNDVAGHIGIAIQQVEHHEHIVTLSRTDGLTGLLNRRAFFEEEIPRRIQRLARTGASAALFYVDMDNFKRVNDVHGHQRGDEAILALCDLLRDHTRPGDAMARLGGDEFALWLDGMTEDVACDRAQRLLEASAALRRFSGDAEHPLGLSVGVALYDTGTGEPLDDLVVRADETMYAVKRAGKGGYRVAEPPKGSGS
jgi:diguanylate cyclase (GGDEF)-like protein/PAS domain S-box-containing protein